jgi:ribonuclease P/MRP protein subunit POP5
MIKISDDIKTAIMNKIKPVLPSLREKKRYLVFEVISDKKLENVNSISKTIMNDCQNYLGEMGMAKAGLMILNNKYNPNMQRGVIKVSHKMVDSLRAALCFVKEIDNQKVIVKSVGISGILKKAQNKYLAA